MTQAELFPGSVLPRFDGPDDCTGVEDRERLARQIYRIRDYMLDGVWRTVDEIAKALNYPQCSVSAPLRNLKHERFGKYTVNRRRRAGALSEYQVKA